MAGFIKSPIPDKCEIIITSDWHIGSRSFSYDAFDKMMSWLMASKNRYVIFNGDMIEGKPVKSKHFDPRSLELELQTAQDQANWCKPYLKKLAAKKKVLAFGYGNHDLYLLPDYDWMAEFAESVGLTEKLGGYQTWIELTDNLKVFMFHGRRSLPRGAKDPVQRSANRLAWLKRELEDLASSCHVMVHSHVHWLAVLPPIMQVGLFNEGTNVKRYAHLQPEGSITVGAKTVPYVPKESRWYVCSGTLRKSGSFDYIDYSEIAGYAPSAIGWVQMSVREGRCQDIKEIVV